MGKRRRGRLSIADIVERPAGALGQFERLSGMSETHRIDDQFGGRKARKADIQCADLGLRQKIVGNLPCTR